MTLALVTPVHGRRGLTEIVFEQRALLIDGLGPGLDVRQVVVGDDTNLDLARDFDFEVVRCPNVLGARINDGFEFAFRELGVDHVVYCGSDQWLLADPLVDAPRQGHARSSGWLSFCSDEAVASIPASPANGWPPWTFSRGLMESLGFRPVPDDQERILDSALLDAVNRVMHQDDAFEFHEDDDPLRAVDFRNGPWVEQMTSWSEFVPPGYARPDPWATLATRYPAHLVERMERFYAEGQ